MDALSCPVGVSSFIHLLFWHVDTRLFPVFCGENNATENNFVQIYFQIDIIFISLKQFNPSIA